MAEKFAALETEEAARVCCTADVSLLPHASAVARVVWSSIITPRRSLKDDERLWRVVGCLHAWPTTHRTGWDTMGEWSSGADSNIGRSRHPGGEASSPPYSDVVT
ncbi:hypothetical protein V2G26_019711 [Clonostachys chloroleuca]